MSYLLVVAAMYSPSRTTALAIAESTSCPTSIPLQSLQHSKNTRHGQNDKADTRSRSFALTAAQITWTKWRNMSNPLASSTILLLHTLHNRMALQKESTVPSLTWFAQC